MLCAEQQRVVDAALAGNNICIVGSAGTGKSYVVRSIITHLWKANKKVAVTAMTGAAARLLLRGSTLHRWGGIGIGDQDISHYMSTMSSQWSDAGKRWQEVDVLVVDECSMMSVHLFELLDEIGTGLRGGNQPFGGIQLIFVGDIKQLLPVAKKCDPPEKRLPFTSSPFFREAFKRDCVFVLQHNHRQDGDPRYAALLERIGLGQHTVEDLQVLHQHVCRKPIDVSDELMSVDVMPTLFGTNAKADALNESFYLLLNTEEHTSQSCDEYLTRHETPWSGTAIPKALVALMGDLRKGSRYPHTARFKIGQYVLITKNIAPFDGWINGTTATIVAWEDDKPLVCRNRAKALAFLEWGVQHVLDNDGECRDTGSDNDTSKRKCDYNSVDTAPLPAKKMRVDTSNNEYSGGGGGGSGGDNDDDDGDDALFAEVDMPSSPDRPAWMDDGDFMLVERSKVEEMALDDVGMVRRHALPLRHARGMTVHRSQGATFDRARMMLSRQDMFAPGQVYVALGRVKSLKGLVLMEAPTQIKTSELAKAFYKEYAPHKDD